MKYFQHAAIALAVLALALLPGCSGPEVAPKAPLKPCEFEDSTSCFWDATTRGNGMGRSFLVDEQGRATYLDGRSG